MLDIEELLEPNTHKGDDEDELNILFAGENKIAASAPDGDLAELELKSSEAGISSVPTLKMRVVLS